MNDISPRKSQDNIEKQPLISPESPSKPSKDAQKPKVITSMGLKVLGLLAFQNAFKNILMRVVMKDHAGFLLSTAVIVVELLKLLFSTLYIMFVMKQSPFSIIQYVRAEWKNSVLLVVPACAYSLQMSLEYVAMANIDPATFSVLVQTKMLSTAFFFGTVLKRKLMKKQFMSLVILTVGVMLCSMKTTSSEEGNVLGDKFTGICATLGIATSSGFASVYTEKVIKSARKKTDVSKSGEFGLAHMQAQLAIVSLVILGVYAVAHDYELILQNGFFQNYDGAAFFSSLNSACGGLVVAAVLKYADSILKGYATALSVVMTGLASNILFGTELSLFYVMGIVNVIVAVLLYNSSGLDDTLC